MSGPGGHGGPGGPGGPPSFPEPRKHPPITEIGMLSMVCIIIGVIWMASHLPKHAPLGLPVGLLVASAAILAVNIGVIVRIKDFAFWRFVQVLKWGGLAYVIIAGMIEYAFIYDHTRGSQLVVMTLMLALFSANVPILLAFTVARFETATSRPAAG